MEAGGTKCVCGVGSGPADLERVTLATTTPDETLHAAVQAIRKLARGRELTAIGIASFGPVDLEPGSQRYGFITTTPKPGWQNTDVVGVFRRALSVPVGFDTDVNGALLGEVRWGAVTGMANAVYLTVGTGIGGGAMVNGHLVHGLLHPEMGHMRIPHDRERDPFAGCCDFHGDCLEGLACGLAIEKRLNARAETLAIEHPVWDLEAEYLGAGLLNIALTLSPERIILGGSVMKAPGLLERVRAKFQQSLAGYIQRPQITRDVESYIVPPALGDSAGVIGAIALAQDAAR
jgi:fructokinase